ncbi:LysR family transcriptional regulator [Facilibium subflavum]|uniref:LysR family transcriptional regulator n=1 Tax=Facilibium subflavum TaxID=2219058 RepID=UPI000E6581FE|nr:LysR family transcriptional regulator [Facilibium subflavum]
MNYTLQQLSVFVTIVELKSLTKSAHKLHLTPPALTKQVQNLEAQLGFSLFDRRNNRLILQDKGVHFYHLVKPVLNELDRINNIELPHLQQRKVKLKIALSAIFENDVFKNINHLLQHDQSFCYDLMIQDKNTQLQLLQTYQIDVALVVLDPDELELLKPQPFQVVPYKLIKMDLYVAKEIIDADKEIKKQLSDLKFILQTAYSHQFYELNNRLHFSSYTTILHAIQQGIGYGFLPTALLTEKEREGLLNINHIVLERIADVQSYYIYAKNTPQAKAIRSLFHETKSKV